jgi:hypothetical protein
VPIFSGSPTLHEVLDSRPWQLPLFPDVYRHIVGVTHEPQTPLLQLLIEFIKHDVGQQRREGPALRRALLGLFDDLEVDHPNK